MYEQIAKVQRSKTKRRILKLLNRAMTPTQVEKKLVLHITSASRSMRSLEKDNLLKCLNPKQPNYRYYKITPRGLRILKEIEAIEKL